MRCCAPAFIVSGARRYRLSVASSGSSIATRSVASTIDPYWTFQRMLQPNDLPEEFLRAIKRIDYSSASAKVNVALAEPPRGAAAPGTVYDVIRRYKAHWRFRELRPSTRRVYGQSLGSLERDWQTRLRNRYGR